MLIAKAVTSYKQAGYTREIPDNVAYDLVYMVEHGVSIDAILDVVRNKGRKQTMKFVINKLCRNTIIRHSELFCALMGVKPLHT